VRSRAAERRERKRGAAAGVEGGDQDRDLFFSIATAETAQTATTANSWWEEPASELELATFSQISLTSLETMSDADHHNVTVLSTTSPAEGWDWDTSSSSGWISISPLLSLPPPPPPPHPSISSRRLTRLSPLSRAWTTAEPQEQQQQQQRRQQKQQDGGGAEGSGENDGAGDTPSSSSPSSSTTTSGPLPKTSSRAISLLRKWRSTLKAAVVAAAVGSTLGRRGRVVGV
jgi:hypothetical protein